MDPTNGPIAIVGLACRLPGNASTPAKLWDLLADSKSTWTTVPASRYNEKAFLHENADFPGGHNHEGGHFLKADLAAFDAAFFGISPLEAQAMDPQQRLLLETTYEAFENGGITMSDIRGSNTSVYVANFTNDYDKSILKDTLNLPKYHITGCGEAILANRLSYVFDLRGPSVTLNTGCSGGLVALHQACQSLQLGESEMAVVAGANLILSPDHMISMSNLHMLNSQGHSYSFDSRGTGYGRGEGIVSVLLKPLERALRDGDLVRAIIRGTGVNQDGKTHGITRPSADAQQALIERVLRKSMTSPERLAYLEAHGTGTKAGDDTECKAIANAVTAKREGPLWVGSVKSNIGHLEACSGLAALVKTVLILEKGLIPPNANFRVPKAGLDLETKKIKIPTSIEPLLPADPITDVSEDVRLSIPPVVGISSFGYGGTNSFALLESKSAVESCQISKGASDDSISQVFLVSAHSEHSVRLSAERLSRWLFCQSKEADLKSLAYTLSSCRTFMPWRIACTAATSEEFISALRSARPSPPTSSTAQPIFVFSGQGAQWPKMGVELLDNVKFRKSLLEAEAALNDLGASWGLVEELKKPAGESRIHDSKLAQPLNTALQIALTDTLFDLGLRPKAVIGHSSGEIAAAYAAGILSAYTALRIAYYRGVVSGMAKDMHDGGMVVTNLSESEAIKHLRELGRTDVSIACINSSKSTTLSGSKPAISRLKERLDQRSIAHQVLSVDVAYHSKYMHRVSQQYHAYLGSVEYSSGTASFFSSVSGSQKTSGFGSSYWTENLVSQVRFSQAVQECVAAIRQGSSEGHDLNISFLELGPHKVLANPLKHTMAAFPRCGFTYASALSRSMDSRRSLHNFVGFLFEQGLESNKESLAKVNGPGDRPRKLNDLPSYSWDHSKSYWYESWLSRACRQRKRPFNDLLGVKLENCTTLEPRWRYIVSLDTHPWLSDHMISTVVVYPGAGYLCMVIEAAKDMLEDATPDQAVSQITLRDVSFLEALFVPQPPDQLELQLSFSVHPKDKKDARVIYSFRIAAHTEDGQWVEHCRGLVDLSEASTLRRSRRRETKSDDGAMTEVDPHTLYRKLDSQGNTYGEHFALVSKWATSKYSARATVEARDVVSVMPAKYLRRHVIHPTTLDAVLHSSLPLCSQANDISALMPTFIESLAVSTTYESTTRSDLVVRAQLGALCKDQPRIEVIAFEEQADATPILEINGLQLQALAGHESPRNLSRAYRDICYQMRWDVDADSLDKQFFLSKSRSTADTHLSHQAFERKTSKRGIHAHFTQYAKQLLFKRPQMAVLEIGSRSVASATAFLQAIGDSSTKPTCYDITNMSPEHFENMKDDLKAFSDIVQFRTLNISEDPEEQGFVGHSYDVVIATSVFHQAVDVDKALDHVRKLLRPDGKLIIIQNVETQPYVNGNHIQSKERCNSKLSNGHSRDKSLSNGKRFPTDELYQAPILTEEQWISRLTEYSYNLQFTVTEIGKDGSMATLTVVSPLKLEQTETLDIGLRDTNELSSASASLKDELMKNLRAKQHRIFTEPWDSQWDAQGTIHIVLDGGDKPILVQPDSPTLRRVLRLLKEGRRVLWLSSPPPGRPVEDASKSLITGLARIAHSENSHLQLVTFDIQQDIREDQNGVTQAILNVLENSFNSAGQVQICREREYVYKDDQLLIPRLISDTFGNEWISGRARKDNVRETYRSKAIAVIPHKKSSPEKDVMFTETILDEGPIGASQLEIDVVAWSVYQDDEENYRRDRLDGQLRECTGIVRQCNAQSGFQNGQKVFALCKSSFASRIRINASAACALPLSFALFSFEFLAAYHILKRLMRLRKHDSILIQDASNAQGQAVLAMAVHIGADVIATVSTESDRQVLIENFGLSEEAIGILPLFPSTRTMLDMTNGPGVDAIVDCSISDENRPSLSCVSPFGKYVRLRADAPPNQSQPSTTVTSMSFDPNALRNHNAAAFTPMLSDIVDMLSQGMNTLDHLVEQFPISRLGEAIHRAASSEAKRKTIATADEDDLVNVSKAQTSPLQLSDKATYLISGGLGDVGRSICEFVVSHGAKHVVALSRRPSGSVAEQQLASRIRSIASDASLHVFQCDISDPLQVRKAAQKMSSLGLPPVRGIVQATVVLHDQLLENLTLDDFRVPLAAKIDGTLHLQNTFTYDSLDFFLVLPSVASLVGSGGQAGYGPANTFQDQFAMSNAHLNPRYLALDLGMVGDSQAITPQRQKLLEKQGLVFVQPEELGLFLEYALSPGASQSNSQQLVMGLNPNSVAIARDYTSNGNVHSPMFSHILPHSSRKSPTEKQPDKSFKERIASLKTQQEIENLVTSMLISQLSAVVASNLHQINSRSKLSEMGIDSLSALELKNWAIKEFGASLRTSELLEQRDIRSVAHQITTRSKMIHDFSNSNGRIDSNDINKNVPEPDRNALIERETDLELPQLPLPDLKSSLDMYLRSREVFMTEQEYAQTSALVSNFLEKGDGRRLQKRLQDLLSDLQVDNWLSDIYADNIYLSRRDPVYPYGIFIATHPLTNLPHTQAERAAVIAKAAIDLRRRIEDGTLQPDSLNGERLCMESSQWLFNVCREPHIGTDRMTKYRNEDYFAVLRRGHLYRVDHGSSSRPSTFEELEEAFGTILNQAVHYIPSLATLTAEPRDEWAEARQALTSDGGVNAAALSMVERASFVICLDDGSPSNASERCNQFFLGDPTNRWADKTVQYVVCENGTSAFIGEHARIDGMGARPMVRHIADAIMQHKPVRDRKRYRLANGSANAPLPRGSHSFSANQTPSCPTHPLVHELPTLTSPLRNHISSIQQRFRQAFSPIEFRHFTLKTMGNAFLRAHKVPPKTAYQLVIQLAVRLWYGHFPDVWETVSTARFRKGRIDWLQTVSVESAAFVEEAMKLVELDAHVERMVNVGASDNADVDWEKLKELFHTAAAGHVNAVARVAAGHGFKAHLHALRAVARDVKRKRGAVVQHAEEVEDAMGADNPNTGADDEHMPQEPLDPKQQSSTSRLADDATEEPDEEEIPPLFLDKQWLATEVSAIKKVKVDCLEGMPMQETCFLMPRADCIFLHYEVEDDGCIFFVQTWPRLADEVCAKLEAAAGAVRRILVA